ncbi:MAG: PAS domain S-box protein [Thermoplasmata archaeon]
MTKKPTYEELEQRVKKLEKETLERKRAEEVLRERERYFHSLLSNMHEDILVVDREYRITDANKAFLNTAGRKREEIIGHHCYEISHNYTEPCEKHGEQCMLREVFETGEPRTCLHQHLYPDGSKVWVDILLSPLRDENGNVTHVIEAIRDITEIKQKEEALRSSEGRYRDLYDNAPVMYHTIDTKGIVLECNQTEADMLGYSKEEIIGKPIYAFETKEYQDLAPHALQEGMEKGHVVGERRFVRKDGTIIDTAFEGTAIHDDSGRVVGFRSTVTDITHLKRTEEALQESEQKYKTITESSLTGIYIHQDGRCVFVNDRFAQIHGYKRDELLGEHYLTLIHPDERERVRQIGSKRLKGEPAPKRYEVKRLRKDGEAVWCETIAVNIEYRGKPAIMGNIVDINEHKRAEEALRESELWMRSMFNSLEEAVLIITPDRFIVDINEATKKMLGYSKGELINRSTEIIHVDHEHYLEGGRRMKEAFDSGKAANLEFKLKRKNGDIFPSEHTVSLLKNDEGKPMGIVSVVRDLSERKRAEEEKKKLEAQFQAAQRMEAMGSLAGGIAHNFNNILMGIQGNASLALLRKTSTHPDYERLKGIE